jgi:hypothetical protein
MPGPSRPNGIGAFTTGKGQAAVIEPPAAKDVAPFLLIPSHRFAAAVSSVEKNGLSHCLRRNRWLIIRCLLSLLRKPPKARSLKTTREWPITPPA